MLTRFGFIVQRKSSVQREDSLKSTASSDQTHVETPKPKALLDAAQILDRPPRPLKRIKTEESQDESAWDDDDEDEENVEPATLTQLGLPLLSPRRDAKSKQIFRGSEEKPSMYVQAFETILDTVLENELHLFSEEEMRLFAIYKSLRYEARYLFVRLFTRKAGWFRINKLQYGNDVVDMDEACALLWSSEVGLAQSGELIVELEEALSLLSLDELKVFAKDAKVLGKNKDEICSALMKASKEQSGLNTQGKLTLSFDGQGNWSRQDLKLVRKILKQTGACIRLHPDPVKLFHRLHIVFYRSTNYDERSITTLILARISKRKFPEYIVERTSNVFASRQALLEYEDAIKLKAEVDNILEFNGTPGEEGLRRVLAIFESIWDKWKDLVSRETEIEANLDALSAEEQRAAYYLRRFTAGWVLTRLVWKGAYALSRFHEYQREHAVISALLGQRLYRRGKRGEWYDRKALIEQRYMASPDQPAEVKKWKKLAAGTCEAALQDPDVHIIYHSMLQKRLMRLEKDLRIPKREQHDFSHVSLRKAVKCVIEGERISEREIGRKSVWRALDGGECSVEQLALSHYESRGWRGYHSENGLLTSIFALLFWDILFLPLPGVFETAYQTAPLDLASDAFYPARASEINRRLAEVGNGGAVDIMRSVDECHRAEETWCVGLRWSYPLEDLTEVATCLGGPALASIFKMFAEEYSHRTGGLPDLCIWKMDEGRCMFVEVKGPGDRLSQDKQVNWIDVLLGAGVEVELCSVVEGKGIKELKEEGK
ncbi:hypothetical protein YB2330_003305 [Saitoella coloradoensis]